MFLQRSRQVQQVYASVRWHDLTFPSVSVNGNKQAEAPPKPHDLNMTWVGEAAVGGGWAKSLPSASFFNFLFLCCTCLSYSAAGGLEIYTFNYIVGVGRCGRHLNEAFQTGRLIQMLTFNVSSCLYCVGHNLSAPAQILHMRLLASCYMPTAWCQHESNVIKCEIRKQLH